MPLKVVELDKIRQENFLRYIMKDPVSFFFFVIDWENDRESSRFLLVIDGERIVGSMLIFKDRIAQPRGSARAVKALIEHIDDDATEAFVQLEHRDIILKAFKASHEAELHLLHMESGKENLSKGHLSKRLRESDAREAAALMRAADPVLWGKQTAQMVRNSMKEGIWVGVKDGKRLAAIGMARVYSLAGMIHTIATAKAYRNRGYAWENISALLREILRARKVALICVLKKNGPAYHVYTKAGFERYKKFFHMKGIKRIDKNRK